MASGECSTQNHGPASLNRSSFLAGFIFGTASSAYQIRSRMVVVEWLLLTRTIVIRIDFHDYVELCYRNFGDRVKQWITVNEPLTFASLGYANGAFAPGRCSNCSWGNSGTEPYIVSHHLLLAHAAAVKLYRDKYQVIAVPLNIESETDHQAASRSLSFSYDWFLEPLKSGSYPADMVNNVGERLPRFNKEQSLMVQGSFDFLGLNYYTSNYATNINIPCKNNQNPSYLIDSCVNLTSVDEINDGKLSLEDNMRIEYYRSHLSYVQSGIM
ncbi:hypothetical protein Ddye_031907 [Dipteronia dyeriana]|uniref:Beta-glucosidase n=1 Tax=Dipteronia dyeriana TaxID=168575 RepID=A0AAD9TJ79_9ROSI|nr:hypothetical protein Ddye_031907 [Dipteronia dyeriana]